MCLCLKQIDPALVKLINMEEAWKIVEIMIKTTFPALLVLRMCDKKDPVMDTLWFYARRMNLSIEKMRPELNDLDTTEFETAAKKLKQRANSNDEVPLGQQDSDSDSDTDGEDDEDTETEDEGGLIDLEDFSIRENDPLGDIVLKLWTKRLNDLHTGYALTGWFTCPIPEVIEDRKKNSTNAQRMLIDQQVIRLMHPGLMSPSDGNFALLRDESKVHDTLNAFWEELDQMVTRKGPFEHRPFMWKSKDLVPGKTYKWHKQYSVPATKVYGKVAAMVSSKIVGIGSAERCWGSVKTIKSGKKAHYDAKKAGKKATIYAAGRAELEQELRQEEPFKFWDDGDIQEHFDVLTARNKGAAPAPESREFKAWYEEWEDDCKFKNDPVEEMSLLKKYGGLKFIDPDSNSLLRTIHAKVMAWTRPTRSSRSNAGKEGGWNLICYDQKKYDPNQAHEDNDFDSYELIAFGDSCLIIHTLLRRTMKSEPELNPNVALNDTEFKAILQEDSDEDDSATEKLAAV